MTTARPLPHSAEAEASLVGAMLLRPEALERLTGIVRPEDCYDPRVQILLETGLALQTRGVPIDVVTLEAELRAAGKLEKVGGIAGISEYSTSTAENVEFHARLVRDRAQLRRLIRVCQETAARAYGAELPADELIQDAADGVSNCFSGELGGRSIQEVLQALVARAEERTQLIAQGREEELHTFGVPTGLQQIDGALTFGGLPVRQPTIVGADTSVGKSSFATGCMWTTARRGGGCLYCTLEDEAESPTLRIVSDVSRLGNRELQSLRVSPDQWPAFESAVGELWNKKIHFFESSFKVDDLVGRVKRYVRRHKPRLVVVDYLQLLEPAQRSRSRQEEIDETLKALVLMARSLPETATLIVSQFHRRDRNQRPTVGDFYHSGAIEQWAHTVLLLWGPVVKHDRCKVAIVAKQKNGSAPVEVVLGWDGRCSSFCNADAHDAEIYWGEVVKLTGGKSGCKSGGWKK